LPYIFHLHFKGITYIFFVIHNIPLSAINPISLLILSIGNGSLDTHEVKGHIICMPLPDILTDRNDILDDFPVALSVSVGKIYSVIFAGKFA